MFSLVLRLIIFIALCSFILVGVGGFFVLLLLALIAAPILFILALL